MAVDALKRGWGGAQGGHFKAIFDEAAKPNGFGVAYFEGLLAVGNLHSRINLPLKWFLGTYPVFLDLVHEAMLRDRPTWEEKTTRLPDDSEERTTRLPDRSEERTTRLPDPSDERTSRLWEDDA
jgi:hypothetical protein